MARHHILLALIKLQTHTFWSSYQSIIESFPPPPTPPPPRTSVVVLAFGVSEIANNRGDLSLFSWQVRRVARNTRKKREKKRERVRWSVVNKTRDTTTRLFYFSLISEIYFFASQQTTIRSIYAPKANQLSSSL